MRFHATQHHNQGMRWHSVRRWILTMVVILASGASIGDRRAQAADLVVDNVTGSDAQNDRGLVPGPASFGPYRTIMRALAAAQPGDRIVLTPTGEPYRECVSLTGTRHSGGPVTPFQIIGNGATLDGSRYARPAAWESLGDGYYVYQKTPPGFGLMLLDGNRLQYVNRHESEQTPFTLEPLQWTRIGGRFHFRPEPVRSPADYEIEITEQPVGISLYDVDNVVIRDLTIRGYHIDGINAHDRATGVRLINVTCLENGRSGVSVGGASEVLLESSRLSGNGVAAVRTEGRAELVLEEVQAEPAGAAGMVREGGVIVGELLPLDE